MILPSEVTAILDGTMPSCQIPNCIEHFDIGGFHSDVPAVDKKPFTAWVESSRPLPDQMAMPVAVWMQGLEDEPVPQHPQIEQLDLLEQPQ